MLIAVISDIHDNLVNLKKCLNWCRQNSVVKLICCGDVTNLETIIYLARNFSGEIFLVRGNIEIYPETELASFKNINYGGEISFNKIDDLNIGLCHEPRKIERVKKMAPSVLDFIFYGHTHKPWIEKDGATIIANPGTLGGVFNPATFAIFDTTKKNLELKVLADL